MASVSRWDPIVDLFRGFFVRSVEFNTRGTETPSINIHAKETLGGHAEWPGMNKGDIHVALDGEVLLVSAERKQEKKVNEGELESTLRNKSAAASKRLTIQ